MEVHFNHDFKRFVLGKLPLLNKLKASLVIGSNLLTYVKETPFVEIFAGLNNLGPKKIKYFRIDYVRSYSHANSWGSIVFGIKFLETFNRKYPKL